MQAVQVCSQALADKSRLTRYDSANARLREPPLLKDTHRAICCSKPFTVALVRVLLIVALIHYMAQLSAAGA